MSERLHIYFHVACFDGAVSAAIVSDYLTKAADAVEPALHTVGYDVRRQWLDTRLPPLSAVVDFAYHPDAMFWADHHPTTFLAPAAKQSFEDRRMNAELLFDSSAPSCADVLFQGPLQEYPEYCAKFKDAVRWANKIDSANYDDVYEAIEGESPAQMISASFGHELGPELSLLVARELRGKSLEDVASLRPVSDAAAHVRKLERQGLDRLGQACRNEDDVVVFDIDTTGFALNRYSAFYLYPNARYSAGLVRSGRSIKLTTMRNPWLEFSSVPLGEICQSLGGGGHTRVGSILFRAEDSARAVDALRLVVQRIQTGEPNLKRTRNE